VGGDRRLFATIVDVKWSWYTFVIVLFLMAGGIALMAVRVRNRVEAVHFILPSGFRGTVWVMVDPRGGGDIRPVAGRVTLSIPTDGVLTVKSDAFLTDWHKSGAEANGRRVPSTGDDGFGPDAVGLRGVTRTSEGVNVFVVGTRAEEDAIRRALSDVSTEGQRRLRARGK
jgi:hypothetical protein